jgi:hypothetical protein
MYMDRIDEDYVNCNGFELIHMREQEPPIDLARPVLQQRRFWFRNIPVRQAGPRNRAHGMGAGVPLDHQPRRPAPSIYVG